MLEYRFEMFRHSDNLFRKDYMPRLAYVHEIKEFQKSLTYNHSHTQYLELLHIIKGCTTFEIKNKAYRLNKGDTVIINPQQLHRIVSSEGPLNAIALGINNLQIDGLAQNYLLPIDCYPVIHLNKYCRGIGHYFELCKNLAIVNDRSLLNNNPQTSILNSLLVLLHNILQKQRITPKNPHSIAEKIKRYLDEHFLENLNLETIALDLHLNKFYLSHCFKNYMCISPMQYVTQRRISEAQFLLISTELTITEISFHCGFNNSNYFQTTFKNTVGITPGKFRKEWK